MTMPMLEGLDGVQKMSKSLGNYVGINEPPGEMFGKLMSISDDLMWRYYLLLTDMTAPEIGDLLSKVTSGAVHPMEAKKSLARRIVEDFHGAEAAAEAQDIFESTVQKKRLPEVMPSKCFPIALSQEVVSAIDRIRALPLERRGPKEDQGGSSVRDYRRQPAT